jgi:serine/threonine protein kinase
MATELSSIFKRARRLRGGHASIVWQYTDIRKSQTVVVKYLKDKSVAKDEVRTLKRFWHPNVINCIDFIKCNDAFGIVMYSMDMDLRDFMLSNVYGADDVREISLQLAHGLHHVHGLDTIHADIKPENIGISIAKDKDCDKHLHVKIIDFGSARHVTEISNGVGIRSTFCAQSPEKRRGVFGPFGDIFELGLVYQEVSLHSTESAQSNEMYGGLVHEMLQAEPALRPTSHDVLVRLNDPLILLWDRLNALTAGSTEWKADLASLSSCIDPLPFLARDFPARMAYIIKLTTSDSLQKIEKAFFFLLKTAQGESVSSRGGGSGDSVLNYIHHFHGVVDTTWWTKLFYCMAISTLCALPGFALSDTVKLKLWSFSGVEICERYVRLIFSKCQSREHLQWCYRHPWGANQVDFAEFVGNLDEP